MPKIESLPDRFWQAALKLQEMRETARCPRCRTLPTLIWPDLDKAETHVRLVPGCDCFTKPG